MFLSLHILNSKNTSSKEASPLTSSIVPDLINFPSLIMAILSQSFSATSKTCVEKRLPSRIHKAPAWSFFKRCDAFGSKPHKRFIHDDRLRLMDKSGNNRQFLLHTMGISRDRLCKILRQFKHICIFANTLLKFLCTYFKNVCHKIQKNCIPVIKSYRSGLSGIYASFAFYMQAAVPLRRFRRSDFPFLKL